MATDSFVPLNQRQEELCRECGMDPTGMSVFSETENMLRLRHHRSGNDVWIDKGYAQKRKEQGLW